MLAPRKKLWSSPEIVLDKALEMLKIEENDVVYDIGCGDGRFILKCASNTNVKKSIGIEINEERCKEVQNKIDELNLGEKCSILCGNALEMDFSNATAIFIYLVPRGFRIILPYLLKLNHPLRVVTYMSPLPEQTAVQIEHVNTSSTDDETRWPLYLYHIHPESQSES